MMATPNYTLLDHTADLGIRIFGTDLIDLFETAGKALMHLMIQGESPVDASPVTISLSGADLCDLMVRWLGEILYLLEGEKLVVNSLKIADLSPSSLAAILQTVPLDLRYHEILNEIKAVTYHQIAVAQKADHWEAKVIMDL